MIILKNNNFSVRPYAKKLISESDKLIASGKNKWDVAKRIARAKDAYEKSSRKITSLNPIKIFKNSKDASESKAALDKQLFKILTK